MWRAKISASSSEIHFFRVVLLDVEGDQIVLRRLGEIDEVVGLVDQVAGPAEMVGAPFQAERLGHRAARVEQFARHGMALPQSLAEPQLGLVAGAFVGRRQPVRALVDEAHDALVAGQLVPVDRIVFVSVDDEARSVRFQGSEKSEAPAGEAARIAAANTVSIARARRSIGFSNASAFPRWPSPAKGSARFAKISPPNADYRLLFRL